MTNAATLLALPYVMNPYPQMHDIRIDSSSPIFSPRKHTRESYASQQRKAKQRRKSKKYNK